MSRDRAEPAPRVLVDPDLGLLRIQDDRSLGEYEGASELEDEPLAVGRRLDHGEGHGLDGTRFPGHEILGARTGHEARDRQVVARRTEVGQLELSPERAGAEGGRAGPGDAGAMEDLWGPGRARDH